MHPRQTRSLNQDFARPAHADDFIRLPGLFRRWEIPQVVPLTRDERIEPAGMTADGTPVFSVYRRVGAAAEDDVRAADDADDDDDLGVPVVVSFEDGRPPVRANLLPLEEGYPVLGVLIARHDPDDEGLRARVEALLDRAAWPAALPPPAPLADHAARHAPREGEVIE